LILFHEVSNQRNRRSTKGGPGQKTRAKPARGDDENSRLRLELAASREYLQSIIQDLEATNEELQSANEEVLSSNEELQSTNEELDTAKEELQSTNEELNTLNEELHGRNEELSRVNSDLVNLLGSVQIAIVIVSGDMRIRRFTPMAERILNLLPADIGRPIAHIKPNIECADLEQLITRAIDEMAVADTEVRDRQNHLYSLRIRPYKNVENRIDGAVLALVDIHSSRRNAEQVQEVSAYAESLLDAVHEPVMLFDRNLLIRAVNRAYVQVFGLAGQFRPGSPLEEFHGGVWNQPELRTMLRRVLAQQDRADNYRVSADFPGMGLREVLVNARAVIHGSSQEGVLVAIQLPSR
jgi:two-component system CheB/CheR fusion protein